MEARTRLTMTTAKVITPRHFMKKIEERVNATAEDELRKKKARRSYYQKRGDEQNTNIRAAEVRVMRREIFNLEDLTAALTSGSRKITRDEVTTHSQVFKRAAKELEIALTAISYWR